MRDKNLVFVVSGGRTGTKFFGTVLGSLIENCYSVHEPDLLSTSLNLASLVGRMRTFGFYHMVWGRLLGKSGVRILNERYLKGEVSLEEAAGEIRRYRARFHASRPEPLIVESYSQWFGLLPALRTAFPHAKIVCVVRDPRTWVQSCANHGRRRGFRDLVEFVGQSRTSPTEIGDKRWAERWPSMTNFQRLCWDWNLINGLLDDFAKRDGLTRLYRFEDLFDANRPECHDMMEFITQHGNCRYCFGDIEAAFARKLNASAPKILSEWPSWSIEDARFLHSMCGPLMKRYGYGDEPEWKRLLAGCDGSWQEATLTRSSHP